MNLRSSAIVLSLLPLAIVLLLAVPEGLMQWRVSTHVASAHRSQLAAAAAGDIGNGRVFILIALRRYLLREPTAQSEYVRAASNLRAAMLRLKGLAGPNPATVELSRHVILNAANVLRDSDAIDSNLREGHLREGPLLMTRPAYLNDAERLQASVRAFVESERATQESEFASFEQLWGTSIMLLLLAVVALATASALLLYYSGSAVRGIFRLREMRERFRLSQPLGPRSQRHDEIGILDAAFHDFVAIQDQREGQLEHYRLLSEVTQDIILFLDRDDLTVIDANAAALKAYGYERSQFIGKPLRSLAPDSIPIDAAMIERSDTLTGAVFEMVHQRSDGTLFPVEIYARGADVNGRRMLLFTARDISERRRAAEQIADALSHAVEASKLKSEFVATMSHEIRTPMHGVIGMSELLLERPLGPIEREYATTLKESAQALLTIIDDILDFSKLEANRIELEAVAFDPAQLVAGVVNLVRGASRGKGLALHSYASPHVPSTVTGDPTRLRQILMNLVGNAVKFTANGGVTVSLSVERNDGNSVTLVFAVSDTGIGVAPETVERLFEAFTQGDSSTTRRFGGTGLGLSISRHLVKLMGGRIWLGEHQGPGSTFCFTARFERAAGEVGAAVPAVGALRVLVLDDDESTRRTLEATLSSWGMHVASCSDIDAARAQLRDAAGSGGRFDVVLIDYVLPRSDGLAFAAELGEQPEYGEPARILLTAFDAVGREELALAAGCAAYLPKPFDPSDLYDALNAIELGRKTPDAEIADKTRRANILLAEDSDLIRRVARFQLQDLHYGVDVVENGAQAVAAVAAGDYQLVLMDMRMPEMDGLTATRAIRAAERVTGRHVIVVALTANVLEGDREACMDAGMDDFLTKPLQLDALRTMLERWLPERV